MELVFVHPSSNAEPLVIEVPGGGKLVDVCDTSAAPVPFSCRSASCGTCRIEVLEGAELLEPALDEELEVLDVFGDDPKKKRLACQARLCTGRTGRIKVRAINEPLTDEPF